MTLADPGINIMILDDEEEVLNSLNRYLSLMYTTHPASTPDEARRILATRTIDLCLIDQNLHADVTGLEFAHQIKELDRRYRIIMLTGETDSSKLVIDALNSSSIDTFLTKPFEFEELMAYIDRNVEELAVYRQSVSSVLEKMRSGLKLSALELKLLMENLEDIGDVVFDTSVDEGESLEVLGLAILKNDEVGYLRSVSDQFSIKDEFMMRGLFLTLTKISGELFVSTNGKNDPLEEIRLANLSARVRSCDDHTVILFHANQEAVEPQDLGAMHSFIQEICDVAATDFANSDIDAMLERFVHYVNTNHQV